MSSLQPSYTQTTVNNVTLDPIILFTQALQQESDTLRTLIDNIPQQTHTLIQSLLHCAGSIIFTGAGKSGHVAKKLSATFSSLGISSFFMHPYEALHGDLGCIKQHDYIIMLSKSAASFELELIATLLKQQAIKTFLISCAKGPLISLVSLAIQLPFEREACFLNLAPTSSSTLMMAYGDALATTLSFCKNFTSHDFAYNHPAGSLGKSLTLTAGNLMVTNEQLPLIKPTDSFTTIITTIMEKKIGTAIVVNNNQELLGIITDGDIRRACAQYEGSVFNKTAHELMTLKPKTISLTTKASLALNIMEDYNITSLVITNEKLIVLGIIHIHALIKAGIRKDL